MVLRTAYNLLRIPAKTFRPMLQKV